ncbi:MAG: hypothetical protein ATN32_05385 [Candidatus Epulonipiscium fishelsonii]|nr:MAG: hypothetical protein ATN32_05385 [Epulopiscium sp. AS2M-Bin002]
MKNKLRFKIFRMINNNIQNPIVYKTIRGIMLLLTNQKKLLKLIRLRYFGSMKIYKKNPNCNFYIIANTYEETGFFANFNMVLQKLIIADNKKMRPIIDMKNYKTVYNENHKVNNSFNAWEYYFYQPIKFSLEEVYLSKNVIVSSNESSSIIPIYKKNQNIKPSKDQISKLNYYIKKYIKIKPQVEEAVQKTQKQFYQFNKVVGVHIRATDMYVAGGHHPIPPGLKRIIPRIDYVIKNLGVDGIFVCTDDANSLDILKKRYGNKIIYTNSIRANKGSNVGIHLDEKLISRKNHKYLLGLEVLVDMLLLSRCNLLIGGHSNVTYTALMFNNNQYEKVYLLENK